MNTRTLQKGEIIFRQGDASDCMYDVYRGKIGVYANYGTPGEKLLTTLEAEQFFGEMGMIEGTPRSATAVALTDDTELGIITPETFKDYFQKSPARVLLIMQNMSRRLRGLTGEYLEACRTVARGADAQAAGAALGDDLQSGLEKLSRVYQQSGNADADN